MWICSSSSRIGATSLLGLAVSLASLRFSCLISLLVSWVLAAP
ncbi:MAG: hypothetical protein E6I93_00495 [Chloroflexi bacterium]|nr:MAG: hypothetical protein E6I93_00495 [Chloroflexota bacterium]